MMDGGTTWERLGAPAGGSVAALLHAGAGRLYAATPVGIRISENGGVTWRATAAEREVPFCAALAAGGARSDGSQLVFAGNPQGLFRSTDAGASWRQVLREGNVLALAVAPGSGDELTLLAGTEQDGILRSEDGGDTWLSANPGLLDLTVLALAVSPAFPSDRTAFAATTSGIYRTRNGARSWRALQLERGDSSQEEVAVQCLAISPDFLNDRMLLAGTETSGLLCSRDAGETWEAVAGLASGGVTCIAFADPERIMAATESGAAISCDAGKTWDLRGVDVGPVLSLANIGNRWLAGSTTRGVLTSDDDGCAWAQASQGLDARVLVGLLVVGERTLFAADAQTGISRSQDAGLTWRDDATGLEDAPVYALARADSTLLAGTGRGVLASIDAGATWQKLASAPEEPVRVLAAAPDDPSTVIAALGGGRLAISEDAGATWRNLESTLPSQAEVVSVVLSPRSGGDRTLFVGSSQPATVWRSTDGGARWRRWLLADDEAGEVVPLALSPGFATDGRVYVGLQGRVAQPRPEAHEVRGGERRPLWRMSRLADGTAAVTALLAASDGIVVAATSQGLFVSFDTGQRFSSQSGEARAPRGLVSLASGPDGAVYALALGGAVWRTRLSR
jgi:photosystem II stability/assembly factor-like uncharacterized protein